MSLSETERAKYERMWAVPAYRNHSPGEPIALCAMADLGAKPQTTVIDFGCGTGRPAQTLAGAGFYVVGVDHTRKALDEGQPRGWEFVEACLWEMPDISAEWGYCTDVMEHIPTEKVHDTLASIRERTNQGVYFQIATFPDGVQSGGLINSKSTGKRFLTLEGG